MKKRTQYIEKVGGHGSGAPPKNEYADQDMETSKKN